MHPTDPMLPLWFLGLVLMGFGFGALAARLFYGRLLRNAERATWAAAARYYTATTKTRL